MTRGIERHHLLTSYAPLSRGAGPVTASGYLNSYFSDNSPGRDHAAKSLRGGVVSVSARAAIAFIQIGSVLFLARLLTPEDYGLVSMVTALTGFASVLTDLGTRDAITQRRHVSHGEISALFWITAAVGVVSALAVAACAPLIARFYGEPRLTMIVVASSFTFIATALAIPHTALMRRALMFRDLALIELGANLVSALVAIVMALLGYRYWALVGRLISTPLLSGIGIWSKCRWLPGKPMLTAEIKDILKFGLNITGFTMAEYAARSGDRVVIGYRAGATIVGQYQNALLVYDNLAGILVQPLHPVAVASLGKLRGDPAELRTAWAKALSTLAFYAMPAFGLLAVSSRDLIVIVLGAKWASAGVLLSVLALRGIPHSIERTAGWLHVTAGRTDRWMRWGIFAAAAQLVALMCGAPFGPMGVAVAYVVPMFALFVPALVYAGRPLGISRRDVINVLWRQLVGAMAAVGIGFLLRSTLLADTAPLTRTTLLIVTYVFSYSLVVVGMFGIRSPLSTARLLIRHALPPRLAHLLT
jgi:PST family polysaccharide transporter